MRRFALSVMKGMKASFLRRCKAESCSQSRIHSVRFAAKVTPPPCYGRRCAARGECNTSSSVWAHGALQRRWPLHIVPESLSSFGAVRDAAPRKDPHVAFPSFFIGSRGWRCQSSHVHERGGYCGRRRRRPGSPCRRRRPHVPHVETSRFAVDRRFGCCSERPEERSDPTLDRSDHLPAVAPPDVDRHAPHQVHLAGRQCASRRGAGVV